MVSAPSPTQEAQYSAEMPVLFIWILNIFAKAIISQLVNEVGAQPAAAEPIGILTVSIFGQKEFLWRGKTFIDIFMAKMRKMCPVLWGFRGNEKTEGGRTALGWHKDGDSWVDEQVHNNRMMGLGSGYASICLRDFGKSQQAISPWHPTHYWQSMSVIVNTPPDQTSPTQFMVLKALIDQKEKSFLKFYGTAAMAALRLALVDFPAKQKNQTEVAVGALKVLASKLERDHGLQLY
jgi:nucleoporin GLE1